MKPTLQIVLFEPLIPQNTGTIARLCAATYTELHLIQPLGFELSDRYLKRAGLDYWDEVILFVHASWEAFLTATQASAETLWFFTKHSSSPYYNIEFKEGDFLVFGNETQGLPANIHERYSEQRYCIPMDNPNVRSLNLSNAASIVYYEARRQLGTKWPVKPN